ncbi:zinc finger protein 184-like isoform X2 [Centropristis striata]|uniref:zinc finger protein 184-like isoform X2 n=1 Tax=Centropristis striata TaxID=184440 RepID=UPI0027E1CFD4|nr:zinc finger protein 184-like isoform X2 [Centropristis striata]
MSAAINFHSQIASIMEVLANAAVAEICKVVDDGYAVVHLEMSRSQKENEFLRKRIKLLELQVARYRGKGAEGSIGCRFAGIRLLNRQNRDSLAGPSSQGKTRFLNRDQGTQHSVQRVEPVNRDQDPDQEVVNTTKTEDQRCLKDTGAQHKEDDIHEVEVGSQTLSLAAKDYYPLNADTEIHRISVSGRYETLDFVRLEVWQQEEASTHYQYSHPADQSHKDGDPNRARPMIDLTKEADKYVVGPSYSLPEGSSISITPDVDTALIKTLDPELLPKNTGVKGLCGAAAELEEAVLPAVKLEAEPSLSEVCRTHKPLGSVTMNECLSNSRSANTSLHHTEKEPAELDTSSLDSSSFDDLFSSPEVARSLTAHKHSTNGVAGSNVSSEVRSRSFVRSSQRAFSCQSCGCICSTSRDLMVHQRSHAGEKIYHCHLCKKPFVHLHQLKTHKRVHTGEKPFSCTQCGKRFSQSSHIKRHMSVHTGEKRYSCGLCGKRFSQACSLKAHQTVHTGERPYSCTNCGKSFSVHGNLIRHQNIHIGK